MVVFIIENRHDYICNYDIRKRNTRQVKNQPTVSLSLYQKGLMNMGIKIWNNLPSFIKESHGTTQTFKLLRNFLYSNTFYTLDEYFEYKLC